MRKNSRVCGSSLWAAAFALSASCGLINVNGKPMAWPGGSGSGSGSGTSGNASAAASSAASETAPSGAAYAHGPTGSGATNTLTAIAQPAPYYAEPSLDDKSGYLGPQNADFRMGASSSSYYVDWVAIFEKVDQRNPAYATFLLANHCLGGTDLATTYQRAEEAPLLCTILLSRRTFDPAAARTAIAPELQMGHAYVALRIAQMPQIIAAAKAAVAAEAKADPAVAKLVALHDSELKRWATPDTARSNAMQLAQQMAAAAESGKKSAVANCYSKTHPAFAAAVADAKLGDAALHDQHDPIVDFQGKLITGPTAYWSYVAMRRCVQAYENKPVNNGQGFGSLDTPAGIDRFAGPYTSTLAQWLRAASELSFDQRDRTMASMLGDRGFATLMSRSAWGGTLEVGHLAAITPTSGNHVKLTFKSETAMFDVCAQWRLTNRIESVSVNGQVTYVSECLKRKREARNINPDEFTISAAVSAGLNVGMLVSLSASTVDSERGLEKSGVVLAAADASGKLVYFAGAALKP